MKTIWVILITFVVSALAIGGGTYYFTNANAKIDKDNLQLQINDLNNRLDEKVEAVSSSGTVQAEKNYNIEISYSADTTVATIKNNGVKVEDLAIQAHSSVNILKQTKENAYLEIAPDGIGGYILYRTGFPTYRLNLASNKLVKISDAVIDISSSENYITYIKYGENGQKSVVLLDLRTNQIKEFKALAKYGQIGDALVSPDEKKIAYAAAYGDATADEGGDIYIINISTGEQEKVNRIEIKGTTPHVKAWSSNGEVSWQ